MTQGVVLLHGILRTKYSMRSLEHALRKAGYATLNITYPSRRLTIEQLAGHLHPAIQAFTTRYQTVHFIGHSMGGLVIRHYLSRYRPANLGRVLQLASPNKGSEVADYLQHRWLYKKLYGPAGQQLITQLPERDRLLPPIDYPLGVIMGDLSWEPVCNRIIGQPNDGKVSVESSKVDGMAAHRVIRAGHSFLPANREAQALALSFLQTGHFSS